MIYQPYTSPHVASLKHEHRTYEHTSLVSPREINWIWTSLLISSYVIHHPWTYPLMAQHLPIQVWHHFLTQHKQLILCSTIAWRSPKRRQAKSGHTAWRFKPHRQAPGPRIECSLLRVHLADPTLLSGANRYRPPSWSFYRLAHLLQPPGTMTVTY